MHRCLPPICAGFLTAVLMAGCAPRAAAPAWPELVVSPVPPAPSSEPGIRAEPGDANTLDITIKDGSLDEALRLLGKATDTKIVVAEGVTANVQSLNLHRVTMEQALDGITQATGTRWRKQGDTYVVFSASAQPDIPVPADHAPSQGGPQPR